MNIYFIALRGISLLISIVCYSIDNNDNLLSNHPKKFLEKSKPIVSIVQCEIFQSAHRMNGYQRTCQR